MMKSSFLILLMAASAAAVSAQTPAKPAAPAAAKPAAPAVAGASTTAKTAAKPVAASPLIAPKMKAPAGIPQHPGLQKTVFTAALRTQEIKLGTGAEALPGKQYKILYHGYRASDGIEFDSTDQHRQPLKDKDGKPVLGDDGKPKLGDPQPMPFVQGQGHTIIGFDQGFFGMKVGGQRRIFIPWQFAYGTRDMPDHQPMRPGDVFHPGIPSKSDLIFDVELVDVSDAPPTPSMPNHPGMVGMQGGRPMPPKPATPNAAPAAPGAPAAPSAPPVTPSAAPVATPVATPTPAAPVAPAQPATK
jgi:peptidylprolyl isomerase